MKTETGGVEGDQSIAFSERTQKIVYARTIPITLAP
jgi:hypothetical protein